MIFNINALSTSILLIYLWKVLSPDQLFSYSCLSSNTVNNLSSKRLFYHKVKCTVFLLQWDLFFHSQLFHWSWRSEMLLPLKVNSKTLEISEIYWKLSKTATTLQTELIWQKNILRNTELSGLFGRNARSETRKISWSLALPLVICCSLVTTCFLCFFRFCSAFVYQFKQLWGDRLIFNLLKRFRYQKRPSRWKTTYKS